MKRLSTLVLAIIISTFLFAQAPQKMSYQAVIRDASNNIVANHAVGMKISILKGSATGIVVYTETQTPTTNANGLVSIEFGGGTGFISIDWSIGSYFIQTETDPTGGTNYTITGTSQLLSVPYAMFAGNVNINISKSGDTLFFGTKYLIIPGISGANYPSPVSDSDGNKYDIIKIGTQTWMVQNLMTTLYNDGSNINNITDTSSWRLDIIGAYCNYNNTTNLDSIKKYGRLYNWYAVNTNKLCPLGWHVPNNSEWGLLNDFIICPCR